MKPRGRVSFGTDQGKWETKREHVDSKPPDVERDYGQNWKRKLCWYYENYGNCKLSRGECYYAHGQDDLSIHEESDNMSGQSSDYQNWWGDTTQSDTWWKSQQDDDHVW